MSTLQTHRRFNDVWRFSFVLAAVILVFISPALLSGGYYAPAENIRRTTPFLNGEEPHNYILMDPLVQMMPWHGFARQSIHHGHLPLWNPYSGGGAPLLANPQATVLFPLTWLHFIFNFKIAFVLIAFLKLFLVGFWTYLYLRQIKMQPLVAGIGGIAFTFCGFNVSWLAWPLPAVIIALPCGLFLLERYFAQFEPNSQSESNLESGTEPSQQSTPLSSIQSRSPRHLLPLVWLSLAVAWCILAGHPQTFFHITFVLMLYAIYKTSALSPTQSPGQTGARPKIKTSLGHVALVAGAFVLGGMLAAVLYIPFAEYLLSSYKFISRSEWVNVSYLPANMAILNFIPDFFGHPVSGRERFATSSYNESTMSYVGLTMLFFAVAGVLRQWRQPNSRPMRFFALLALFCAAIVYNCPLVFDLVTRLPVFHQVHNHRLALQLGFCVVVLGCYGMQELMNADFSIGRWKVAAIIGALLLAVLLIANRGEFADMQRWQMAVMAAFALNALALAAAVHWAKARRQLHAVAFLVLLETAGHGMVYNGVTAEKDFFPANPVTTFLQKRFERTGEKMLSVGYGLPPNMGTWYGFAQVREYDAIGMRSYESFRKSIDPATGATEKYGTDLNFDDLRFAGIGVVGATQNDAAILQKKYPELKPIFRYENYVLFEHPVLPRAFLMEAASLAQAKKQLVQLREDWKAVPIRAVQSPHSWRRAALEQNLYFDYTADKPSFLVVNQAYMPGWSGRITANGGENNGAQSDWFPAQAESVVQVLPAAVGRHRMEVAYRPASLSWGKAISAVAAVLWLLLLALCWKDKRRREPEYSG